MSKTKKCKLCGYSRSVTRYLLGLFFDDEGEPFTTDKVCMNCRKSQSLKRPIKIKVTRGKNENKNLS